MGNPWASNGKPMGIAWAYHGLSFSWPSHRQFMNCQRTGHEQRMGIPWASHGPPVGCPCGPPWGISRYAHGLPMGFQIYAHRMGPLDGHRMPMSFLWTAYGLLMGYPWDAHEMPMGCPWAAHGLPMVRPGLPVDCPWTARGMPMNCPWDVHGMLPEWQCDANGAPQGLP